MNFYNLWVMTKALLLDRDGVINVDYGYVCKIEKFIWQPGIFHLCREALFRNYKIIIITNQSGIAREYYSENDMNILHDWMIKQFFLQAIEISAIYHCPHHPEAVNSIICNCRKPDIGMFTMAIERFCIDVTKSIMVGDKETDLIPAHKLNINHRIQYNDDKKYPSATKKIGLLNEIIDLL